MTTVAPSTTTAGQSGVQALFNPRGIAVIGASSAPEKIGAVMAQALSSYEKPVVMVNPRSENMYASVKEAAAAVDSPLDLAVLCVPAAATAGALRSAAEAGVSAALVCAGGFTEAGDAGLEYEQDVLNVVAETGIRLLGPNTSGFFIPSRRLMASFVPGVSGLSAGSVGVISSSGGVNHSLSFQLEHAGVGVSLGVGLGAGIDLTAADVVEYLSEDPQTKVLALHVETVADGPLLLDAVRKASAMKPVVALVVGKNDITEFAQSHTGALATSWRSTCSALRHNGAVIVGDETEMVDVATALSKNRLLPNSDPGIGVITGQAGPGLIIADHLADAQVRVPPLSRQTTAKLSKLLPPLTFQENPVDTGRPDENLSSVIDAVATDPAIDGIGLYGIIEPVADFPEAISSTDLAATAVVLSVDGLQSQLQKVVKAGAARGVPVVNGPSALARGLVGLVKDSRAQWALRQPEVVGASLPLGTGPWTEAEAKDLLEAVGIRVPNRVHARSHTEAHAALDALESPVAVKIVDAGVLHKTEIGGVHLDIATHDELDAALSSLDETGAQEYLVEEMASDGVDLVVGARRDPVFGAVILVGIGGTAVEAVGDVALQPLPLREGGTASMIQQLTARDLLHGWRGGPVVNESSLAHILAVLGETLRSNPTISEIEVNPLRLDNKGLIALDAVIVAENATGKEE